MRVDEMYIKEKREELIERMTDELPVLRKKLRLSQEGLSQIIGNTRYTVMSIENRKRKMTWTMFLALILVFEKNGDTSKLLRAFNIYTEELDAMICHIRENSK